MLETQNISSARWKSPMDLLNNHMNKKQELLIKEKEMYSLRKWPGNMW